MKQALIAGAFVALTSVALAAQEGSGGDTPLPDDDICAESRGNWDDRDAYCEVREATLDTRSVLRVDGRTNGGITVVGWDRDEILVRAKVVGRARDGETARELVEEVEISFSGTIEADGPRTRRRQWWHVSYEIFAPHESNLDLESTNGGIGIYDITGDVDFDVVNGGAHLYRLAGNVRGETTNGGLHIVLDGDRWEGDGLDVRTTNGGVTMWIPEDYNARLETGAVNGGISIDFPIIVQGRIGGRRIATELGEGGPLVRAVTTNGGVRIRRS
ncbi:MAG: hypothetical protein ACE5FJ_06555 [Gemmatimonadales bacterium]